MRPFFTFIADFFYCLGFYFIRSIPFIVFTICAYFSLSLLAGGYRILGSILILVCIGIGLAILSRPRVSK